MMRVARSIALASALSGQAAGSPRREVAVPWSAFACSKAGLSRNFPVDPRIARSVRLE
ncbi:hypothetical protein [Actinoplanes sp. NPDC051411]|uniref:hypothetical protein n=1 Tax=Actinoplanes sp. NPDC051411 TaxID=3155522 RepID=UPI003421DD01